MRHLNVTLDPPEQNLALDEAILLAAEESDEVDELFRLWEPGSRHVVVGRGSRVDTEVQVEACRRDAVPILRRMTGGAAILGGPGCLVYSVVLRRDDRQPLQLDRIHHDVLSRHVAGLRRLEPSIRHEGTSDLTIDIGGGQPARKVSGNSLRIGRRAILYHGTILYDFPLSEVSHYLKMPPRQPDYRQARSHDQFLTNLCHPRDRIVEVLLDAWQARQPQVTWPEQHVARLVQTKYACDDWNQRL